MRYQQFDTWICKGLAGNPLLMPVAATHRSVCALEVWQERPTNYGIKVIHFIYFVAKDIHQLMGLIKDSNQPAIYPHSCRQRYPPGIVVTDGGCSVVADAQGAARAVEAMKTHLVDVEVCKMGAAVLYVLWLEEKIWEKNRKIVEWGLLGILSFSNSEVLV